METEQEATGTKPPQIRRGKVDSLTLYEITDHELHLLERGSPSSVYLSFALVLLSTSASFLISLLTASVSSGKTFTVFVVVVVVGFVAGLVLLILWWKTRQSAVAVVSRIQSRVSIDDEDTEGERRGS